MANGVVRDIIRATGLAGVLCALAVHAADDGTNVIPGSKAAQLDSCVEPTEFMRRNHMELIKHQRDETVHQGIRSTKHSLAGCVECHVSYGADETPVPVNAEGQFCNRCHEFAAVGVDCFGCHATVPDNVSEGAGGGTARGDVSWHSSFAMSVPRLEGQEPAVLGEDKRP